MDNRKLELVVTRDNDGNIKNVRIRRDSEYIYEMRQYLNKYGNIEFKHIENESIIETPITDIVHPILYDLTKPTEELLYDIRSNFLKITGMYGNYYKLHTRDKELVLDRSSDKSIIGTIKFFNKKEEHSAQEYLNNISDTLRNKDDLILCLNRDNIDLNYLYLRNSDNTKTLDICSISRFEIQIMLSDENEDPIVDSTSIKELIQLIYDKRRMSLIKRQNMCKLGEYILNLKNKEKKNEVE